MMNFVALKKGQVKIMWLLFLLLVLGKTAHCQVIVGEDFSSVTLENNMGIFRDSTDALTITDFIKNPERFEFTKVTYASPNIGRDLYTHWITFELENITKIDKNVFLYLSQPFLDFLDIYVVENGQVVEKAAFQYETKLKTNLIEHVARPVLEIEAKSAVTTKVFVKFRNTGGVLILGMELMGERDFFQKTSFEQNVYLLFFGIILAFALLAIAFFVISKSRIYLFYGLYVLLIGISIHALVGNLYNASGFKLDFFNGDSSFRFYSTLGLIFNVYFLRELFETTRRDRFYHLFTQIILVLCFFVLAITVLDWGFIYYPLSAVLNPYVLFIVTAIVSVYNNFKRRPNTVKLYFASFSLIFLFLIIRVLSELDLIGTPIHFSYYALPAVVTEFFVLLVGLSSLFFKKIQERNEFEAAIVNTQISTQESERRQIAMDLHDDLGSTLSILKEKMKEDLQNLESRELINKAIEDLRSISNRLLPIDFEQFGFIKSVEKYISNLNVGGVEITLIVFGEKQDFAKDVELNLYRILTEILHNIKKHSASKKATLQLVYHSEYLWVSVEEESSEKISSKLSGIGQKSISSRLDYLRARVLENGTSASGYQYIFEIPYDKNPDS